MATSRALIVEHDAISLPGLVGDALRRRGFELDEFVIVTDPDHDVAAIGVDFPDPTEYDCIVPMGSPWSVYDPRVRPWVAKEVQILRDADRAGVPVLGVCFGGQLLAEAHGGSVYRGDRPEFGWRTNTVLVEGILDPGPWFQWHSDNWVVPPGGEEVAVTESAPQAFVLRRNLAVQFHPEITPEILALWLAKEQPPGQDPAELMAQTVAHRGDALERVERLLDAFLCRVARR